MAIKQAPISNPDDAVEVYHWFLKRFPNWTPNKDDVVAYRVTFNWPFPMNRDGAERGQVLESIYEWQKVVWKKYSLGEEFGDEQSFFHNWGYAASGHLSLAISSDMVEAVSEVMGNATYYLLTYPGFKINFETLL